jgi:formylglycine-generating enzyme required for sulfatase activity
LENNSEIRFKLNQNIIITGDNSSDFLFDSASTQDLITASKNINLSLIFKPRTAGIKKAALTTFDSSGKAHDLFSLSGTASPPMIAIPTGVFQMGNNDSDTAMPAHLVYISNYYLSKYEVTFELWDSVKKWAIANGYSFGNNGIQGKDGKAGTNNQHPVTAINWFDAAVWCNALSELSGLTPVYYTNLNKKSIYRNSKDFINLRADLVDWNANGYRLPTEAEFEYAMRNRGKRSGFVYSGSENLNAVGWYIKNSRSTHQVGEKFANELGLYDMSGNVWEWCWDRFDKYTENTENDPRGPEFGSHRVLRGGSWCSDDFYCEVSERGDYPPKDTNFNIGFRIARSINNVIPVN